MPMKLDCGFIYPLFIHFLAVYLITYERVDFFFYIFALGLFLRLLLKIIGMTEKGAESLGNLTFFSNSRLSSVLDQWNQTFHHTLLQKKRLYLVHWLNEFWMYKKEKFLEFKSIHSKTKLRGTKIELTSKFFFSIKIHSYGWSEIIVFSQEACLIYNEHYWFLGNSAFLVFFWIFSAFANLQAKKEEFIHFFYNLIHAIQKTRTKWQSMTIVRRSILLINILKLLLR